jgi:fructokinase
VRPVLTVVGEALIDLVAGGKNGRHSERPGGSPFNVAVGLARLGNRTSLMARFSDDRYGRLLRSAASQEGIDLRAAPRAAEPTTVAVASVGEAGHTTYRFEMDGTADWQWTAAELRGLSPETEVFHFGSIASWTSPGAERIADLVAELRATGRVLISYDPNVRPTVIGTRERALEFVERAAGLADLVKASREDLDWLYPGLGVDEVAKRWGGLGASVAVVTDGAAGATAFPRGRSPMRRPGRPVTVLDTIGAGDAFTAGLLTGVVRRRLYRIGRLERISDGALADVVDEAVLVSAITCEREGADPPRLDDVRERLGMIRDRA